MTLPGPGLDRMFEAPLLAGLDPAARTLVLQASRRRDLAAGEWLYREHDDADAIFVVLAGALELVAVRRGDETPTVLRRALPRDTLGEEAGLSLPRRAGARASEPGIVAEIPAALLRRGLGRRADTDTHGGSDRGESRVLAEREQRWLERSATADLLRTLAFTRDLGRDELDIVLDAVAHERHARGTVLFAQGDPAEEAFLLVEGLIQLQRDDGDEIVVQAYLGRGDVLGDEDVLAGEPRTSRAVTMGPVRVLRLPSKALRTITFRNPDLLAGIRRAAASREHVQHEIIGQAARGSTQHVFRDVYRMTMARSLLVIDQDSCVRCGHCAWSCAATHDDGLSRLHRRGDKLVARVRGTAPGPRSLLLPNACQHCRNPACMIDCPTGAIGRDPSGEVFIHASLCTGCGNCAKACPWDNIHIGPRAPEGAKRGAGRVLVGHESTHGEGLSAEVAIKCDLCREHEGPACVQACPTGSIVRLDPARDFSDVAALFGDGTPANADTRRSVLRRLTRASVLSGLAKGIAVLALVGFGQRMHALGRWHSGHGLGLVAGIAAALGIVLLALHALPKRRPRAWMRPRVRDRLPGVRSGSLPIARSRMQPLVRIHVALGWLTIVAVAFHVGPTRTGTVAGTLLGAFALVVGLGLLGALLYRVVPPVLGRIEREGALPEDLPALRERLHDRLHTQASGRSDVVKAIVERVLVPYLRQPGGPARLLASGRSLADEQAHLEARITAILQGRGAAKLAGLGELVRIAVQLRALPLRRVLTATLRVWLPVHVVASGGLLVLLVAHVVLMLGRP